jgi:transcriptional regulator with XRE-family HTH domain
LAVCCRHLLIAITYKVIELQQWHGLISLVVTTQNTLDTKLADTLRKVRIVRRISQLDLSLQIGVSQRHVSFVESGRAKPSRELLAQWLSELQVPFPEHNAIMLQGGFAPMFRQSTLNDPSLAQAKQAMAHLLASHEPFPCFVLDAHWNVEQINGGGVWLAKTLIPWLELSNQKINMLDLLCHPEGFTKNMLNLREAAPLLHNIIKRDAASQPTLEPKLRAFEAIMQSKLGKGFLDKRRTDAPPPLLTTRFRSSCGELAFFSMFTTFGTPQDITLASLKVEHVFAADEATRNVVLDQVGK